MGGIRQIEPRIQPEKAGPNTGVTLMFWFWFSLQARTVQGYLVFDEHPAYATLVDGVITLAFAGAVLMLAVTARKKVVSTTWPLTANLVVAFLIWSGLSVFWTQASSGLSAFGYWMELVLEVFVVLTLLRIGPLIEMGDGCLKGFICGTAALALIVLLFDPHTADRGGLGDLVFLHPNFLGNYFALASLFSVYFASQRGKSFSLRLGWAMTSLFFFGMLVPTFSKTSIVCLLLALYVYARKLRISFRRKVMVSVGVCLLVLVSISVAGADIANYFLDETNPAFTLTGRTVLWAQTWEMIQERPLLGYGIVSFRDYGPNNATFRLPHAHNEWLTLWFQTGVVGLLLGIGIYGTFFLNLRKACKEHPSWLPARLGVAVLGYMLLRGVTEASITDLTFPLPLLLTFLFWATRCCGLTSTPSYSEVSHPSLQSAPRLNGARVSP